MAPGRERGEAACLPIVRTTRLPYCPNKNCALLLTRTLRQQGEVRLPPASTTSCRAAPTRTLLEQPTAPTCFFSPQQLDSGARNSGGKSIELINSYRSRQSNRTCHRVALFLITFIRVCLLLRGGCLYRSIDFDESTQSAPPTTIRKNEVSLSQSTPHRE